MDNADTAVNAQGIDTYSGLHAQLEAQLSHWANVHAASQCESLPIAFQ
jgi:hypothetical protein